MRALFVAAVLLFGVAQFVVPDTVEANNALYAKGIRQTILVVSPQSQGSAFLFQRTDSAGKPKWFAWTAEHVVEGTDAVDLKVFVWHDGKSVGETVFKAKVLKAVPGLDIALLSVEAPPDAFTGTEFASGDPAPPGTLVFIVGNFLGDEYPCSVSTGIVSQTGRSPIPWWILDQTTAAVYPGTSGGPIFNYAGEVLGIVVARVDASLGLFVPVRAIEEWAKLAGFEWAVRGKLCP